MAEKFLLGGMNIPASCSLWEQLMLGGTADSRAILDNVRTEVCVEAGAETRFFNDLGASLAQQSPGTVADATNASAWVVSTARDELLYRGRHTGAGGFRELTRLQRPTSLTYCIPTENREYFTGAIGGLTADRLTTIDCDALSLLLEGYDGPVDTANSWGFAWGADFEEVRPVLETQPTQLPNRLGLSGWEHEHCGVLLAYPRREVPTPLQVPRVFEGINYPPFALVADCASDRGHTKPLTGDPDAGFPEVIHRGCRVRPSRFEVVNVQ